MATIDRKSFLVIFVFWVALPTLDMYSDIRLFHKFFSGPAPDTVFYGKGGKVDDVIDYYIYQIYNLSDSIS